MHGPADLTLSGRVGAAPTSGLASDGGDHDHHHHVAVSGGGAYKAEKPKSAWFVGAEYEYKLNPRVGLGAYYEETVGDFNLQALGVLLFVHPTAGLKLAVGGGVERKLADGNTKALIRILAGYDFHIGNATLGPVVAWDLIEDQSNVVYAGVALGLGF